MDGRKELIDELQRAPADVRQFVAEQLGRLLATQEFIDCLPGHLEGDDASQARLPVVLGRLRAVAGLAKRSARVSSSNLADVTYDGATSTLTVRFHSGRVYAYANVPANLHAALMSAASKGRFFHRWIRARYPTSRVV